MMKMKKLKIDPEISETIKMGLIDGAIELAKDIIIFSLGVVAALSLICDAEE